MCGFFGIVSPRLSHDALVSITQTATGRLYHRGPDDEGMWIDATAGIALGHRRLAIIDLSAQGHQPMVSASGRYVIVYNGEIYNFQALRQELAAHWKGHSDTEVILAAVERWGIAAALPKLGGMFAFALWDKQEQALYLARDRMGEKPLYYAKAGNDWIFGSELKALRAHPQFNRRIDRNALALYMRHNYIPDPYCIYADAYKLPPAHYVVLKKDSPPTLQAYWSCRKEIADGLDKPWVGSDEEAIDELHRLLQSSIKLRQIADVPLGAFLSGGIDSSTVVAIIQSQSSRPVRTFTIGFDVDAYNEAEQAKAVAEHLKTDHSEHYVTAQHSRDVIPKLPAMFDEPFADSSQIPTYLVALLAKQQVTVALSGDAGDELFAGYNRYVWGASLWSKLRHIPVGMRAIAAQALLALPCSAYDAAYRPLALLGGKQRNVGEKIHKMAGILDVDSKEELYRRLVSCWQDPLQLVPGAHEPPTPLMDKTLLPDTATFADSMMTLDQMMYLPGDILTKVDRASMAVSLETRIPFLDPEIIAFAHRLPVQFKIRDGRGKWIVRQVLKRYVPQELIDRPKMGFGVPIGHWLRNELREWGESLLSEKRLWEEGFFNPLPIRHVWQEHLSGRRNYQYHLWTVLMFQSWLAGQSATH